MVSVLTWSVIDHGFEPQLHQTKGDKIGICCFSWNDKVLFVLANCNNSPKVDMSLHSDTLFWFRARAVLIRLSINWKSIKKRVFTFWFNTRENAWILLISLFAHLIKWNSTLCHGFFLKNMISSFRRFLHYLYWTSINWKSIKKRVFTFWFNTRENAWILLISAINQYNYVWSTQNGIFFLLGINHRGHVITLKRK
jgi:hypothetical protein